MNLNARGAASCAALIGAWGLLVSACSNSEVPGNQADARGGGGPVQIFTLSNRADLISAGDALVEIVRPSGGDLSVSLNGADISGAFIQRADGRTLGLIRGLALGANTVQAQHSSGAGARLTITNHPQGGPVFSGPQIQPWTCFDGAVDAQCNRQAEVSYQYRSMAGQFRPYDPDNPPNDVATTTTDEGVTVPYIVRVETGAINRDEYRIAVLADPTQTWDPREPPPQFNRKLVITHGASCDTDYEQASASDVMVDAALSRGFAVMSNALNNSGHNCHVVVQAEAMVMTKERVIDSLGEVRYTIGSGCSGGALAQYWMANAYPGIYQGISPACSFADAWSSAQQYVDYVLLRGYFEDPTRWATGVVWDPVAMEAVYGHPNPANPITFTEVIPNSGDPSRSCTGVDPSEVYDKDSKPEGLRCTLQDYTVNVFGRRPPELWTAQEQQIGRGFARRAFDNVGIQYGLKGLLDGRVSAAQFVDVNTQLGSLDQHGDFDPQRSPADPLAIARAFRSGSSNVANNLDQVAIIDLRGPDPGAFHDAYRAYALRARLDREHGHHDNQLIWRGPVALFGDPTYTASSILALDRWLGAVEADTTALPLPIKLITARPDDVVERCTDGAGNEVPAASCDATVIAYSTPRIEAGMPSTDDVLKCQLTPLVREAYPVSFSDAQWQRLQATFPEGVCDYSRPAAEFTPTQPWLDYSAGPGGVPMGAPPVSSPTG